MNNDNEEISITQVDDIIAVYQQDLALIDSQIATARKFPRNIKRAIENAIATVTIDVDTAQTCSYALPRGGKPITGPSIHLAKILAQNWGNMRAEAKVVSVDAKQITSQAVAFDLENNLAIKVEVKRSIMQNEWSGGQKTGRMVRMNDDMVTVSGNAANSIALRNAILSVIPKAFVDKVYNEAKKTITGDLSDKTKLIAKKKLVFDGLKDTYSVTEKEALAAIGKAAIDHVTAEDILVLIGIGNAIKDGDTTVEQAFKPKPKQQTSALKESTDIPVIDVKESGKKGTKNEQGTIPLT